jgi:hypothetical protein
MFATLLNIRLAPEILDLYNLSTPLVIERSTVRSSLAALPRDDARRGVPDHEAEHGQGSSLIWIMRGSPRGFAEVTILEISLHGPRQTTIVNLPATVALLETVLALSMGRSILP